MKTKILTTLLLAASVAMGSDTKHKSNNMLSEDILQKWDRVYYMMSEVYENQPKLLENCDDEVVAYLLERSIDFAIDYCKDISGAIEYLRPDNPVYQHNADTTLFKNMEHVYILFGRCENEK